MWSFFKKIASRFSSESKQEHSSLFPSDIDKLRADYSSTEELEGPGGPITAREAFDLAEEIIVSFDAEARLIRVESQGKLEPEGRAEGWTFEFILPNRWGFCHFVFRSLKGEERLTLTLRPFAAEGSAMDKMLQDGQAGFVEQQWKVEMERQPSLSHSFQDSQKVLTKLKEQGKTFDLSGGPVLRAVTPPLGKARWELLETANSKKSLYNLPIE